MDKDKLKDPNHGQINNNTHVEEIKSSLAASPNCQKKDSMSTISNVSNVKSKKSSNLLSAFVRRTKRKNKKSETSLNLAITSSPNLEYVASNSTLGLRTEEEDICAERLHPVDNGDGNHLALRSTEENLNMTDSEHSLQSKSKSNFFKKLMKRQSSDNMKKSESDLTNNTSKVSVTNSKESCTICKKDSVNELTENRDLKKYISAPSSHINFGKPTLNITLANGLQSVQELSSQFRESENHLIQILSRYIRDPGCQKELMETLTQHSKLQREAERRTNALANDMWMHQIEIGRAQERTLQETLNTLVKQNRQLQIDNEIMFRKHERLVRKLRSFPETALKYKCMECSSQIDCVIKHNEKLQEKLNVYVQQIDNLENELNISEKQNDALEQQLRHCSSQIHILKATIQRTKTDYELELVTLNYELHRKEQHIKESLESGDALLEDLENLKRQFTGLPFSMNWSKLEGHNKCVTELIDISRTCINELSKDLLSLHTQISLKEKEMEILQETNTKLQENLKKSTSELDNISKKLDENNFHEANKIISEQKCKILENDLKAAEEKIENLKIKFELEKSSILNSIPEYENLSKQVSEKDKMIENTKMFITNITAENLALRNQVDALNRSLSESGAGDIVKELAKCQEQLAYFQSQYYHLLNEKQMLLSDIENMKENQRSAIIQLEIKSKHFRKQIQELEKANEEHQSFKQKYESEHQTVLSLQHERMKYLEEKNVLKTIFQHMKAEITRAQKLECAVVDISKEASKLAVIAEFNKQIGEKLKSEVQEKDHTILQLRTSVEKLNDIQIQNTKEKLSLCYELSEVCQMKEQLNNILSLEMQKNVALDDKKKQISESATNQIKKYEELHRNERSVLRDLAQDYKILMKQNETLVKEKEKLQKEVNDIKIAYDEQLTKCDIIASVKHEKDLQIAQLLAKDKDSMSVVNSLHEKLNLEVNRYDSNTKQLEQLIRQLRQENEELNTSIKYLQNNTQKLHNDLNESRKNEKESKDLLNKAILEKNDLQKDIGQLSEEREKLINEINYLNSLCEKVLSDFEASIKSSVEKEELYKKEINESKLIIISNSREIEHLTETIFLKQGEIEKLLLEMKELKDKESKFNESVKSFENQNDDLKDIEQKKQQLQNEINKLRVEHDSSKRLLVDVKKEIDCMQDELEDLRLKKEEDHTIYKKHLDEMNRKHNEILEINKKEISDLKLNLSELSQKLENERSAYGTLSEIHKDVSAKFIKSIKSLTEEKTAKQEVEAKLKENLRALDSIKMEKEDLQQQINILLDGLNDEKNRINALTQEKTTTQGSLDDLQQKYNDLLAKCLSLEHQLRGVELGVTNDCSSDTYLKDHLEALQKESKENHELILSLKDNITKLQQQITGLEFQKSEMTLRLHEMQRRCETEQSLCEQLKDTHKLVLAALLKMKDDGKVDPLDCDHILRMVKTGERQ